VEHIDCGSAGAAHLSVGIERSVHGEGVQRVGGEPVAQFGHMFAAGVVKVLACGKDLHRLRPGTGGEFQQPRVQALVQE